MQLLSPPTDANRLALRERGHIEGQNIATEYRYSGGRSTGPELAELVRPEGDVIVVAGGPSDPGGPRRFPS